MDISIDSISTIKVENDNKIKKNNEFQEEAKNKEDDFNFEKSFELSKIEILDDIYKQKNDYGVNNINEISDYSFDKDNSKIVSKKNLKQKKLKTKKIKKEELNNIPLPIFSCIFCCNETVSFKHLSNEIISDKYLFQTSIYDINQLDFLISGKINKKINNDKLLNIILDNFENLNGFMLSDKINNFFKSKNFTTRCEYNKLLINKKFRTKLEEKVNKKKKDFYFKEIKGTYKISKNSLNNKCLFNSNSLINNYSSLAGLIPKEPELIHNLAEKQNNSIISSHLSKINIHGNMNKNEIGLIGKDNNKHYVENIVKKIDKNVESDIFEFLGENDIKRKINKKDIEWEDTYYDINNPIIKDVEINNELNSEEDNILEIINHSENKNNHIKNINKHNTSNNIKRITINSENKSNIKMSIFNNSKSLASTNTSSNIIMKDKENKTISIFINKNKILNLENNSALSPKHNNIILKNVTKSSKKDIESNSFKKIFENGKSCLDLKNIHKKILFNHTLNVCRDLNECSNIKKKRINRDIISSNLNIKEKNLLYYNIDKSKNKINNNKYKLKLENNKKNETMNNNTFEKIMKRFKSHKYNNKKIFAYNSLFKFTKDKEKPIMKSPINNIKYSVIHSNNSQRENKFNIFKLKKKDFNIKTENEYLNNFNSPKPNLKVNNIFEKKFITDNYSNENMKYNRKLNAFKNDIRIIF